jgi:hypothetical protein
MADVLAIVGSTRFLDTTAIGRAREVIAGVFERRRPDKVISGAAEGVDTLGVQMAREAGIEVEEFPPANPRWQPDGYQARNDLIADQCTRLLRVACRWSATYGSGYTHDRAKRQGKLVWSVTLPASAQSGQVRVRHGNLDVTFAVAGGRVVSGPAPVRALGWIGRDIDDLLRVMVRRKVDVQWTPYELPLPD